MTMVPSEYVVDEILQPVTLDFPIYIGANPGIEESHVSVVDTFGESNPKWLRDTYRIQVFGRFRPEEYKQGYETMVQIRDELLGLREQNEQEIDWIRFILINGPQFIGVDDRGMNKFSMNFEITAEPKEGVHRQSL